MPYEGPPTANILIVSDSVYDVDVRSGRYLQGAAGETLDKLLRETGVSRMDCLVTTIATDRPPGNKLEFFFEDTKMQKPKEYWIGAVNRLREKISFLRPNLVLALGPVAMYYLTGLTGINSYRGYIVECTLVDGVKVMPVIHPTIINADWKFFFTTMLDFRKAHRNSFNKDMPTERREFEINPSISRIIEYCDWLLSEHKGPIALDVETMSPGAHIDILGIADSPYHSMSINFMQDRSTPRFDIALETKIWAKLAQVIETKELIMQNGTYDAGCLWKNNGILCRNYKKDIMIAAHAAWPETPRSLGYLASVCLNVQPWKHTAKETPELYNAADAANTFGIWEVMEKEMLTSGTTHVHDFEMEQAEVALMLQLQGIKIDLDRRDALVKKNEELRDAVIADITSDIGRVLNFNSPKQVAQLLYEDWALPKQYKRDKKSGENRLSTGADALAVLARMSDNPTLGKIMQYKKVVKLLTFLTCDISPRGTVHTCYNTTGANMAHEGKGGAVTDEDDSFKSFGRWSSSASIIEPYGSGNLQNIPGEAREMYYAGDGKVFVQADYKQAEAVVVAYLIGDKKLQNLFKASFGLSDAECKKRNLDVHKITAATMAGFRVDFVQGSDGLQVIFSDEVSGEMRRVGKTIRHAKNYSAGPGVLARKLGIHLSKAKELMQTYDAANPELYAWQKSVVKELANTRILTNLFNRQHKFLDRWGDDLFRSSYSFIPQSSVGDLLNKALVVLYREYAHEVDIMLQLHDAIYIAVNDNEAAIERGKEILKHCMIDRVQPLDCKNGEGEFYIDIDYKVGKYWGDLHD
jgi:uracil-DNA glycosylase family 4